MLKDRVNRVAFASGVAPSESEYFDIIYAYEKKTLWLVLLFITRTFIPMANGIQMAYYLRITNVEAICFIPELYGTNWTFKQLTNLTKVYGSQELDKCEYLDYNYSMFALLNYEEALQLKNYLVVPEIKNCTGGNILLSENTTRYRHTDVPFCNSKTLAHRVFLLKNFSLMFGTIGFGILGDIFGRRGISLIVAVLWMLCSFFLMSLPDFGAPGLFYVLTTGLNRALDLLTYIHLLEICPKKIRFFAVLTFHGRIVMLTFIMRFSQFLNVDWSVMLYMSFCFSLVSVFHCWYIPESPRWLINQSRYRDALKVMKHIIGYIPNEILFEDEGTDTAKYFEVLKDTLRYWRKRKYKTTIIMVLLSAVFGFIGETEVIRIVNSQYAAKGAVLAYTSQILSPFYSMVLYGAFGKKYGLLFTIMTIPFCSFVTICLRDETLIIDMRATSFILMTAITAEIFVLAYSPDLFPTFLRCTTLGMILFSASIARVVTVMFINWRDVWRPNIYVIFLAISLPGFIVFKLPDTTLVDLPTTRLFRV